MFNSGSLHLLVYTWVLLLVDLHCLFLSFTYLITILIMIIKRQIQVNVKYKQANKLILWQSIDASNVINSIIFIYSFIRLFLFFNSFETQQILSLNLIEEWFQWQKALSAAVYKITKSIPQIVCGIHNSNLEFKSMSSISSLNSFVIIIWWFLRSKI